MDDVVREDILCDHCGVKLGTVELDPRRPRAASVGQGHRCQGCTRVERLRPAVRFLRRLRRARRRHEDLTAEDMALLEAEHERIRPEGEAADAPMDVRHRVSGLMRSLQMLQLYVERRRVGGRHRLTAGELRSLQAAWDHEDPGGE